MNFEDMQKAWQSQDGGAKVTISADALLKEVRRNQQRVREWSLYLLALACAGVGMFMVADRWLQRKKQPVMKDSVRSCVEASLTQVSHQIWLLRNVFWWYLLPIQVGLAALIGSVAWQARVAGLAVIMGLMGYAVACGLLFWGIYHLNQSAVRQSLEPRRQELETLLSSLN